MKNNAFNFLDFMLFREIPILKQITPIRDPIGSKIGKVMLFISIDDRVIHMLKYDYHPYT
jgi:hypothetical protein